MNIHFVGYITWPVLPVNYAIFKENPLPLNLIYLN